MAGRRPSPDGRVRCRSTWYAATDARLAPPFGPDQVKDPFIGGRCCRGPVVEQPAPPDHRGITAATGEESQLVLKWLGSPGVRLVQLDGVLAEPLLGTGAPRSAFSWRRRRRPTGWFRSIAIQPGTGPPSRITRSLLHPGGASRAAVRSSSGSVASAATSKTAMVTGKWRWLPRHPGSPDCRPRPGPPARPVHCGRHQRRPGAPGSGGPTPRPGSPGRSGAHRRPARPTPGWGQRRDLVHAVPATHDQRAVPRRATRRLPPAPSRGIGNADHLGVGRRAGPGDPES